MSDRAPASPAAGGWQRRARPLLGTLVEIGIGRVASVEPAALFALAFGAVQQVQDQLSRFDPASDVSRFHAIAVGGSIPMRRATRAVLEAARTLGVQTDGLFDVTLGSAPGGWLCDGDRLVKLDPAVALDLGGIAKGHAVDCAVQALRDAGVAAGWVNAGGDLRVFGDVNLPIDLRDEATGGVRRFGAIRDGAFATSFLGLGRERALAPVCSGPDADAGGATPAPAGGFGATLAPASDFREGTPTRHVSVAAALCRCADALTKVVAATGDANHPVLALHGAVAWIH